MRHIYAIVIMLCLLPGTVWSEEYLDLEEVIPGVYVRDSITRAEIGVMSMDVESYVRSLKGDGEVKEEKQYARKYFIQDTLLKIEFINYYKDGVLQDEEELQKQIKAERDRRKQGRNRDASVNPLQPFFPQNRQYYAFSMPGIERQHGCVCYHVVADCLVDNEDMLEGDYWIEVNHLNLVHAEFRPARMPSKIQQLDMTKSYAPVEYGYWLPVGFHLIGRGKVLIFIKFNFEVEEKYLRHKIHVEVADDFFVEDDDEK